MVGSSLSMKHLVVGGLQTNCYFISSGGEYLIIDAGGDFDAIMEIVESLEGFRARPVYTTPAVCPQS